LQDVGLLGFWGEWHTFPYDFIPQSTQESVCKWYIDAFKQTQLQCRYPFNLAYAAGFGMGDGSFCQATLDGEANGGVDCHWFFWPSVVSAGQTDFWRRGMMSGETRPEIQGSVFKPDYPSGTEWHQDFMRCVEATHTSSMLHHDCFWNDGYSGKELANARLAHASMGYNFRVLRVCVAKSSQVDQVDVDVTVMQTGVAPFYYPLSLRLECPGLTQTLHGVEAIIDNGDTRVFSFEGVPATAESLHSVSISLDSPYAYPGRPIRFAQGTDGTVSLSIPLPYDEQKNETETLNGMSISIPPTLSTKSYVTDLFIDSTTKGNEHVNISGETFVYGSCASIVGAGAYEERLFQSHRWGHSFTLTIMHLKPKSTTKITLGLAEVFYTGRDDHGKRVMDIAVNGQVFVSNLDVHSVVGPAAALVQNKTAQADAEGRLRLDFSATIDNPMFSFTHIQTIS